ncbi:MAG: SIS domain-containing protein [Candidatus Marsarchaeota archaeon]|nr:SIS domain-containing protein [Candidatus Marsarchaeota archaeon]MCL5111474.1 SIS domain-containing protein [Candidatus Marsarchaeota archaeon]
MDNEFTRSIKEYLDKNLDIAKMMTEQVPKIAEMAKVIDTARNNGNLIFVMGNGGSASTASHLAQDLNKAATRAGRKRFRSIALNDNIPILLAIANDDAYENVFVEQLKNFMSEGDVVIGLSGSGNSKNVLNAIEYANEHGGITIGWTGFGGGRLAKTAKYSIVVPDSSIRADPPVPDGGLDDRMQTSENFHLVLTHALIVTFRRSDDASHTA